MSNTRFVKMHFQFFSFVDHKCLKSNLNYIYHIGLFTTRPDFIERVYILKVVYKWLRNCIVRNLQVAKIVFFFPRNTETWNHPALDSTDIMTIEFHCYSSLCLLSSAHSTNIYSLLAEPSKHRTGGKQNKTIVQNLTALMWLQTK